MKRGPVEQGEFAAYPLAEVAVQLGITTQDTANPVRFLRDLLRRHSIPFIRIGRTIKLRPEQVRLLAQRMVVQASASTTMEISHSDISGIFEARIGRSTALATTGNTHRSRAWGDVVKVPNQLAKTKPRKPKPGRGKPPPVDPCL